MPSEDYTTPSAWTNAFTSTNLNSIAFLNAIAGTAIDNSTALNMFADLSLQLGAITPTIEGAWAYLYPRNKDGTTYGDNRFTTVAAGEPPPQYRIGNFSWDLTAGAKYSTIYGIVLPPGFFKFVLYNYCGVTWGGGGVNTCQYRTYNRAVI
jgi:hypothetical protein